MKRLTQFFTTVIAVGLFSIFVSSVAFAGDTTPFGVDIDIRHFNDGSGQASGVLPLIYNNALSGVYGDAEPYVYIACMSFSGGGMFCQASDADYNYVSCSSDSEFLSESVRMIAPDVRLFFRWNAEGECTGLRVVHSSRIADKQR